MDLNKLWKALLFPHIAILLLLLPVSTVFLIYALVHWDSASIPAIAVYVLAFYTLTVWCVRLPALLRFFQTLQKENRYVIRWQEDANLRINVSLYGTLLLNTAYALLQLGLGIRHHSFWFTSLACYYFCLAVMRFFLVLHTRKHKPGEQQLVELRKYRACGIVFLMMNLALALMIFFMVYWNRTFLHHEITTIALAAYTFTSLTLAIINTVKYKKYNSPVYSAAKAISLASACVSLLTLESTMLTTFGNGSLTLTQRRMFLGLSGGAISGLIIAMAISMILQGTKKIKLLNAAKE